MTDTAKKVPWVYAYAPPPPPDPSKTVYLPRAQQVIEETIGTELKGSALIELAASAEVDKPILTETKEGRYLGIALAFAKLGKGRTTNVGAVILDASSSVRAQGWAGAARGCAADEDERYDSRVEKGFWWLHAEQNAIANAARAGIALEGCTMVVTHPPCMVCANLIVQVGIKRVMCPPFDTRFRDAWEGHIARTNLLFHECGVAFDFIEPTI